MENFNETMCREVFSERCKLEDALVLCKADDVMDQYIQLGESVLLQLDAFLKECEYTGKPDESDAFDDSGKNRYFLLHDRLCAVNRVLWKYRSKVMTRTYTRMHGFRRADIIKVLARQTGWYVLCFYMAMACVVFVVNVIVFLVLLLVTLPFVYVWMKVFA